MDVRFLKTISEAFIIKNGLQESLTVDQVFDDVYDLIKELRETDIELYDHLYDSPKLQQQAILMNYFSAQYVKEEPIEESITMVAVAALSLTLSYLYLGRVTRVMVLFASKIGNLLITISRSLMKRGRYWKFRYSIIEENAKHCYISCGVNEKDISLYHYFSTKNEPRFRISTETALKQGKCLADCYIMYIIECISLLTKSYLVCLKKTGDFDQIKNLKGDDFLKILSGLNLSNFCIEYHNEAVELYSEFRHLLNYVYGNDESKKTSMMRILKDKLIENRQEVYKQDNLKKYNR